MEQMGRRLLCAPFFSTVCLAATALIEVGDEEARRKYLPKVASGEMTATVAFATSGIDWNPETVGGARKLGDGYVVEGTFRHVPDGANAALVLIPARMENGEVALFGLERNVEGVARDRHTTIDATRPLASIVLNGVRLPSSALLARGDRVADGLARTAPLASIGLAAEQLGGAQQCLDLTLAYIAQRIQFGRTIASFQAVKHRCAEMMVRIEATRSAVYGATHFAAGSPPTEALAMEAACAKTLASETFFFCGQEAIQLHGGVGFTWEFDPHLYFKRAQAMASWLGTGDALRERVAATLLDHRG
jgi:alkylation response protein AidB-like acyl-CoA dehydrogenase